MNDMMEKSMQQSEASLSEMDDAQRTQTLNTIRLRLHALSPFSNEPVDCVLWLPAGKVHANDYNPNVNGADRVASSSYVAADGRIYPTGSGGSGPSGILRGGRLPPYAIRQTQTTAACGEANYLILIGAIFEIPRK